MLLSSADLRKETFFTCLHCGKQRNCSPACLISMTETSREDICSLIWSLHGTEYPGEKIGGNTPESMMEWFNRPKQWLGFTALSHNGEPIGHVRLTPVSNDYLIALASPYLNQTALMEVTRLFVHPEWRGRGIAQHLLSHATRAAETVNLTLILRTADYLHASHELYRKNGWKQIGTSFAQYSGDRLLIFIKPEKTLLP